MAWLVSRFKPPIKSLRNRRDAAYLTESRPIIEDPRRHPAPGVNVAVSLDKLFQPLAPLPEGAGERSASTLHPPARFKNRAPVRTML
jgi:hypothetical protein